MQDDSQHENARIERLKLFRQGEYLFCFGWHEAVKAEIQQLITDHREGVQQLQTELNRLSDQRGQALADLRSAEAEKAALGRFASRRQIERANAHLAECNKIVDQLNGRCADCQSRINQMNLVDMKPLVERLNELTAEEARLNHFVTGVSYTTPLGLVVWRASRFELPYTGGGGNLRLLSCRSGAPIRRPITMLSGTSFVAGSPPCDAKGKSKIVPVDSRLLFSPFLIQSLATHWTLYLLSHEQAGRVSTRESRCAPLSC